MVALIPEVLVSTNPNWHTQAIQSFARAVLMTDIFWGKHTQQVTDRVIKMLREATVPHPGLHISHALACCLSARFQTTHVINDYEEAMAIADEVLADTTGNHRSTMEEAAVLTSALLFSRLNSYHRPEYLEDTIHRLRALLCIETLSDRTRTNFGSMLDSFTQQRFNDFGVPGNPRTPSLRPLTVTHNIPSFLWVSGVDHGPLEETVKKYREIAAPILKDGTTDKEVEAAVDKAIELSRKFLPFQQSEHQWSFFPATIFADILWRAHRHTKKLDYLDRLITLMRDLLKVIAPTAARFRARLMLLGALFHRYDLLHHREDFEEGFQICLLVANDESGEVSVRLKVSCAWAVSARRHAHPSMSTAYEAAMSLLQETLVFAPNLKSQHFRLACSLGEMGGFKLPSDYASYQIETCRVKEAIESLERGRALLWSEMRGLRTSNDQLSAANPAFADKLADINRRLESVAVSGPGEEIQGDGGTGTGGGEGMDWIGRLVITQRRLLQERGDLISHIQSLSGFGNFLEPPLFDAIFPATAHGPIIIINQSQFSSHIILLLRDSPPSVISTPSNFHDRANLLKDDLLRVRNDKKKGLDSKDYDLTLTSVLAALYELVGKPVIEKLRELEVPDNSRVWWCPTDAFCSLPLHAMGPIPSDDGKKRYFMDIYITSYTPSLSALIESRTPRSLMSDEPSLLLVAQPDTLPGASGEIAVIQATKIRDKPHFGYGDAENGYRTPEGSPFCSLCVSRPAGGGKSI